MLDRMPSLRPRFADWCQCTRLLLGWAGGTAAEWADLYAAGATPLQAARQTAFGMQATLLD